MNQQISQQEFANLISQFVSGHSQAPGGPPVPNPATAQSIPMANSQPGMPMPGSQAVAPTRAFSPLPPQARPSSAPIGGKYLHHIIVTTLHLNVF